VGLKMGAGHLAILIYRIYAKQLHPLRWLFSCPDLFWQILSEKYSYNQY
jgi:hypothetical protein